ncbi:MAG: hypothetical protein ACC700_19420, partial [Anaerolineales bacterium]
FCPLRGSRPFEVGQHLAVRGRSLTDPSPGQADVHTTKLICALWQSCVMLMLALAVTTERGKP